MNGLLLLNGLPVVGVGSDGVVGYVSPTLRAHYPEIESRIVREILPRFLAGERKIVIRSQNAESGHDGFVLNGYQTEGGDFVFYVEPQQKEEPGRSRSLGTLGELAAGVAHEINTPLQYITDNTQFVADSLPQILGAIPSIDLVGVKAEKKKNVKELTATEAAYLNEELPRALAQSLEGLAQVSEIVQALKEFSHQSQDKAQCQLNDIVRRAVTLTRNEWKYCATVELDLEKELPLIPVISGEVCQALVNLIVNASHAILEAQRAGKKAKQIIVRTRVTGDFVSVSVVDDGVGIADSIQTKIFTPFFTTKALGKGTGQGLSQVKNCVEQLHGGRIALSSEEGVGATFTIMLPVRE